MARKRKTRDVYEVRGNYGHGYECVTAETDYTEAKQRLRECRENEPGVAFKIVTTREKIEPAADTYKIQRMYQDPAKRARTIKRGLTLEQAQAHCKDPETSSSTATGSKARARTKACGPWFDGYTAE